MPSSLVAIKHSSYPAIDIKGPHVALYYLQSYSPTDVRKSFVNKILRIKFHGWPVDCKTPKSMSLKKE